MPIIPEVEENLSGKDEQRNRQQFGDYLQNPKNSNI
jgi:hypothetical protein